jgi:hypothetical protein
VDHLCTTYTATGYRISAAAVVEPPAHLQIRQVFWPLRKARTYASVSNRYRPPNRDGYDRLPAVDPSRLMILWLPLGRRKADAPTADSADCGVMIYTSMC